MIIFSPDSLGRISIGIDNIVCDKGVRMDIVNNLTRATAFLDKAAMTQLRNHLSDLISQVEKDESQTNCNPPPRGS